MANLEKRISDYKCLKENSKFSYFYQNSFWFQIIKRNIVVEMPKYSVMEPGMSSGGKGGKIIFWLGVGSAIIFAIVVLLGTVGKDVILTPGI